MARHQRQSKRPQKQGPPVALRPGPDLERLVGTFADKRRIGLNEAFKNLACLAITGLDYRYYEDIQKMAEMMSGVNAFARACMQIMNSLDGATLVAGQAIQVEPERSRFISQVVEEFLRGRGLEPLTQNLSSGAEEQQAQQGARREHGKRKKKTIRQLIERQPGEEGQEEEEKQKPEWSSEEQPQKQRVRVRS